jgi:multiple sugar transport system permease protein
MRTRLYWVRVTIVILAVGVAVFPFYWMIRTSVARPDETWFQGISLLPTRPTLDNYGAAWDEAGLLNAMVTGLVVTLGILVLQLLTVIPAAFAFSTVRFRGRSALFLVVLASLLVPVQVSAVPNFLIVNQLGLLDSRLGLILPFATSAFGIFLIRQHMLTVPVALLDAARSDGLSRFQTMLRIHVPLAGPSIAAFALFSFYIHWNDYLWPLLVVRSAELRTPPLALAVFQQVETGFEFGKLAAGAVVITFPVVLAFLLAQRRFVQGIAGGEVGE